MKLKIHLLIILLTLNFQIKADVLIVGSNADPDCEYNSIQAAIDSGANFMDIRVTNQLVYDYVEIINKQVDVLTGGFNTCIDAINEQRDVDFTPSQITGMDTNTALKIDINNEAFRYIAISGFDIHDGSPNGVDIKSAGTNVSLTVEIDKTSIFDNHRTGLYIYGTFADVSFQGSIYNNITGSTGSITGGGVYCLNGRFTLQEKSAIYGNMAATGGGLYTDNCDVSLFAGDNNPLDSLQYGIYNNHAFFYGGGARFNNSNVIAQGSSDHPVSFNGNTAERLGGGIFVTAGSNIDLINTRIDDNTAYVQGGGMYLSKEMSNPNPAANVTIKSADTGCNYASVCSSVNFNKVIQTSNGYGGAAFMSQGLSNLNVNQTEISGNRSYRGNVFLGKGGASLTMEGNLITNNSSLTDSGNAASLFETTEGSSIDISYSTIADNTTSKIFYNTDAIDHNITLSKSIVASEQNATIISTLNGNLINIHCSILHRTDIYSDNDTIVGSPDFIAAGDYRLHPTSMAINPSCVNDISPLYDDVRGQDRTLDSNSDIGAYENITADDVIYKSGFE